jgi:hypothetical protein
MRCNGQRSDADSINSLLVGAAIEAFIRSQNTGNLQSMPETEMH